ncbi:MAG TPA: hypothetical protein VFG45_04580 [Candidatus Nitrosocosmicus sp.]|nr:hypothetical protein [Candidatus Nitrosocosmicus sp.]
MVIKRNSTPSLYIDNALYLYFLGLSTRCVAKALLFFNNVKRSHVSIWKWIQRCHHEGKLSTRKNKISEYTVDETILKVGSEFIWIWIAIEPENRMNLAFFAQRNN